MAHGFMMQRDASPCSRREIGAKRAKNQGLGARHFQNTR